MCANCVSTAEAAVAHAAFFAYALKGPVHRALAGAGWVADPDPVAHDVRTVAFLRSLDLDPVEVLGAEVVADAAAWRPVQRAPRRLAAWAVSTAPIGSHSLLSTQ